VKPNNSSDSVPQCQEESENLTTVRTLGNYDPDETPEQLAERLGRVKRFVDGCQGK
jgi:hypothetical protein